MLTVDLSVNLLRLDDAKIWIRAAVFGMKPTTVKNSRKCFIQLNSFITILVYLIRVNYGNIYKTI